jgi:hypothetical protein
MKVYSNSLLLRKFIKTNIVLNLITVGYKALPFPSYLSTVTTNFNTVKGYLSTPIRVISL